MNLSNETFIEPTQPVTEPVLVILAVFVGFFAYGHLFAAIVTSQAYKKSPVYICIFSMGVSDCLAQSFLVFYTIPSRLIGSALVSDQFGQYVMAIQECCWLHSLTNLLLQSSYRFVRICQPPHISDLVTDNLVKFCAIGCWAVGFIGSIPAWFSCCSIDGYTSAFEPQAKDYSNFDLGYSCFTLGSAIITNIITFCHVLATKKIIATNSQSHKRSDVKLFYQLTCVVLAGVISTMTFNILPNFCEEIWVFYLIDFLNILFYTIDAWIYLILNELIRERVVDMYGRHNTVSVGTTSNGSLTHTTAHC